MDLRVFQLNALILLYFVGESLQWRSFKIIFTSINVKSNKELIEAKFDIGNNTNEDTVLNAKFNILQPLDDLEISYTIEMQLESNNYTTILNRSYHLCNFFKNRSLDPILKIIYEDLIKHGNFMKACPIEKGVYFFHEYRIDEELFPSYVPETNFIIKLNILKRNKINPISIFDLKLTVKVDKSKGFTNLKLFTMGK